MVCCVLIALVFVMPVMIIRKIFGGFGGDTCTMAWRPAADSVLEGAVAMEFGPKLQEARTFSDTNFSVAGRIKSFRYAGRGMYRLLRYEHSAYIQLTLALAAITTGVLLNISSNDWRWIVLMIGLVLSAEGFNTAVEKTCDRISLEYSEYIKTAKDVASGAVLLISITAAVIGLQVFLPYLWTPTNIHIPVLHCELSENAFDRKTDGS